jgi:hypothetical protein
MSSPANTAHPLGRSWALAELVAGTILPAMTLTSLAIRGVSIYRADIAGAVVTGQAAVLGASCGAVVAAAIAVRWSRRDLDQAHDAAKKGARE